MASCMRDHIIRYLPLICFSQVAPAGPLEYVENMAMVLSPGASLPLSAGIHLSALNHSYDRMRLRARSAEVCAEWQPRPRL